MQVLLVEQNNLSQEASLRSNLERYGHDVKLAHNPTAAARQITTEWPNLVILNSTPNAVEFKRVLDDTALDIPCIFIGARNQIQVNASAADQVTLLDSDDLTKLPHSIEQITLPQKDRFIRLPDLIIDCHRRNVLRNGKNYSLTPKEFKLLNLLISNINQIISRKIIMQEVWDTDYMGDTRTLDVHIRWIREKIEENPSKPKYLLTARGHGYRFVSQVE